jgi:hypothetical protein
MNFFGGQSDSQMSSRIGLRMRMDLQQICNIRNPQHQRADGYCHLLTTVNLYLMCIVLCLATSWAELAI